MAGSSTFGGVGGTVTTAADGALGGDGSVATPLSVNVDGVTVVKVGNNLTATNNFVRGTGDDGMVYRITAAGQGEPRPVLRVQ